MNLRDYERASIVQFVGQAALDGYLSGRVLDYGCGKQPYRGIVEAAGGEYRPFDMAKWPANVSGENVGSWSHVWDENDVLLSTQVVQYVPDFNVDYLKWWRDECIKDGGHLVLTYPTNWPEVEAEDLHRFTKAGMERLLTEAGFEIVKHEARGVVHDPQFEVGSAKRIRATGEDFVLGYGVVARA